jgi:hypothetical protein
MNGCTGRPVNGLNTVKYNNREETFDIRYVRKHQVIILVLSVGEDSSNASEAKEVST